jgi:hypothetical protein
VTPISGVGASAAAAGFQGKPVNTVPRRYSVIAQPPPYQGYAPPQVQSSNGMAIASMILGILWLYWIGSILALIFGYIGKNQIDQSQGRQGGRGMAVAGIVLGWIGIGTLVLMFLFGGLAFLGSGA